MRISDWSSDGALPIWGRPCGSCPPSPPLRRGPQGQDQKPKPKPKPCLPQTCKGGGSRELCLGSCGSGFSRKILIFGAGPKSSRLKRSEDRRVGKGRVSKCRSRGGPEH